MACACKNKGQRGTYVVNLPGGLKVNKSSEAAATAYAAKHPGATVVKKAA